MKQKFLGLLLVLTLIGIAGCGSGNSNSAAPASPASRSLKVLTISGDWKSQPWYQDKWMQGRGDSGKGTPPVYYRGRFIAHEVEKAAPGRFQFTDVTNYIGQQYGDADYFSQFDVIIIGDIVGWSLPPQFQQGLKTFVQNGGGVLYAASWKWHTTLLNDTPFEEVLPAKFNTSSLAADWKDTSYRLNEKNFVPQVTMAQHPIVSGLNWAGAPALDGGFKISPKDGADVLLKTPGGAPLLAAWSFGSGRAALSASIWANDEVSSKIGQWNDFGKYYVQMLDWLGAKSARKAVTLKDATADITVSVDGIGTAKNAIDAKLFSIHASHDDPGLAPLEGEALKNFQALNLNGGFSRLRGFANSLESKNDDEDPNHFNLPGFNFGEIDRQLGAIKRLNLEPIVLFELNYGNPSWLWQGTNSSWEDPSAKSIAETAEMVAAVVEHTNGKGGSAGYKLNIKYIEICNEPDLNDRTIPGFARLFKGVAQRIHRDYPGVQVGAYGSYEHPYLKQFLKAVDPDLDWVSRHPYGWTGERVFGWQDEWTAFQKANNLRGIPFLVTEWDFWIQGRPKFDYMMTRYFEGARRENLLGTLHYRLGQYAEPIYMFGVLWAGWGQEKGAGAKGTPMHDAYDALWLFRDFRGARVPVQKTVAAGTSPRVPDHVYADAVRDGDKINAVLYYDWAYDGTGYKDYVKAVNYSTARVKLRIALPAAARARTLTVSRATGEGFETVGAPVAIAAGQKEVEQVVEIAPTTGVSVTVR